MNAEPIIIDPSLFVGRGAQRECYIHPHNPGLCLKITVRTRSKWREQNPREYRYYRSLEARGIDWSRIARCYGWAATDKGDALVFQLVATDNGEVCKDLQFYLDRGLLDVEEILHELNMLKEWLLGNAVIICDLKPANIVYHPERPRGQRLIFIDGVNNRNFLKLANVIKPLARSKMKRVWKRFEQRYLAPLTNPSTMKGS